MSHITASVLYMFIVLAITGCNGETPSPEKSPVKLSPDYLEAHLINAIDEYRRQLDRIPAVAEEFIQATKESGIPFHSEHYFGLKFGERIRGIGQTPPAITVTYRDVEGNDYEIKVAIPSNNSEYLE